MSHGHFSAQAVTPAAFLEVMIDPLYDLIIISARLVEERWGSSHVRGDRVRKYDIDPRGFDTDRQFLELPSNPCKKIRMGGLAFHTPQSRGIRSKQFQLGWIHEAETT